MTFHTFDHIPRDPHFVTLLNSCEIFHPDEAKSQLSSADPNTYSYCIPLCVPIKLFGDGDDDKRNVGLVPPEALQCVSALRSNPFLTVAAQNRAGG